MKAVALLAVYNEERFVAACIERLVEQGLDVYVLDNSSTDRTAEIAERYAGRGVVGIEMLPRDGVYSWRPILERKQELAATLDADWFLHVDADEIRPSPREGATLAEVLAEVGEQGYNAVDFQEFTFVPTREAPDHDHPRFEETMRWYYPFLPRAADQVRAWMRQEAPVDLASSGGHRVDFDGVRLYPRSFPVRHYLFLSVEHALRKYVQRDYDATEVAAGWHRARAALRAQDIALLPQSELRPYVSDALLDPLNPWQRHPIFAGARCAS